MTKIKVVKIIYPLFLEGTKIAPDKLALVLVRSRNLFVVLNLSTKINRIFMRYLFYLFAVILVLSSSPCRAETIGNTQKEEKKFGDWQLLCEIDQMLSGTYCKIAAKFFNNTSVISIDTSSKMTNQIMVVIPNIKVNSFVKIKIDKNDLIFSNLVKGSNFGLISFSAEQKSLILKQIKEGDFLFIRFAIRNSEREITAKINLKDFREAINYYNSLAEK